MKGKWKGWLSSLIPGIITVAVVFGPIIELDAAWLSEGGQMLNKPTHFQERKGNF